jgi:ABC-type uncharacterized transport system YnjBCD permease subunit
MHNRKALLVSGIVVGAVLMYAPILAGLIGTIIGMQKASDVLGQSGIADPKQLSEAIGATLVSLTSGLFVSMLTIPAGLALAVVSIVFLVKQNRAAREAAGHVPPPIDSA